MELLEKHAPKEPLPLFQIWRDDAEARGVLQPDAMALATVGSDGRPSVRFVMLRGLDEHGLVFYTNYTSRKAVELSENGWASLAFYWPQSERQVRVEGEVARIPDDESDTYFSSRPREAQLETRASRQSVAIPSREYLERRWQTHDRRFPGEAPRPEWWGGYRLRPTSIEFWQQREHRMHDRLRYQLQSDGNWRIERLSP